MKTALAFLLVAISLLSLIWWRLDVYDSKSAVDIHFHDTYFVIYRPYIILVIFLFLGTIFSLGGTIGTRFRNKIFLIALIIFVAIDGYIIWNNYSSFPACILGNFSL